MLTLRPYAGRDFLALASAEQLGDGTTVLVLDRVRATVRVRVSATARRCVLVPDRVRARVRVRVRATARRC